MLIFLTGGTGYVGSAIVQECLEQGHDLVCLVRHGSEHKLRVGAEEAKRISLAYGDVLVSSTLEEGMAGCDAVVHLVGIIREFPGRSITFDEMHVQATRNITQTARRVGVNRYIHMSALGARIGSQSAYSHTKGQAEQIVFDSGLDWTVFRPSVIFGPRDEFVNMLAGMIRKAPVVPVIGSGEYRLQPVSLANVAKGFAASLSRPETIGRIYDVGGPQSYSYNEMIDEIASAMGKRKPKLHAPLPFMLPIIRLFERFASFPITRAQLIMLLEGNTCDPTEFYKAFQIQPISFQEGIREYVR